MFKNIAIVGVGLIGGSFAKSAKKLALCSKIFGVDNNPDFLNTAKNIGLIDDFGTLEEVIPLCDVVIVAIPVNATRKLLPQILNLCTHQLVFDAGSTKAGICASVQNHVHRANFIAAHPIAGTENSGPEAAVEGLYEGKMNIICDAHLSNPDLLQKALQFFNALQMKTLFMDAEEHDRHIAYVSHLSHISSFVLGQTVLEIEKDEKNIFNMAGSGFASTVRLAKSSPQMWAPIFQQNKEALSTALSAYIQNLQNFKNLIEQEEGEKLIELMTDVNRIRKVIG
jgi:prephenate dehydrogenase